MEQSRERIVSSPPPRCSSYWKGSLRFALDYGRQLYLYCTINSFYLSYKERFTELKEFFFSHLSIIFIYLIYPYIVKNFIIRHVHILVRFSDCHVSQPQEWRSLFGQKLSISLVNGQTAVRLYEVGLCWVSASVFRPNFVRPQ